MASKTAVMRRARSDHRAPNTKPDHRWKHMWSQGVRANDATRRRATKHEASNAEEKAQHDIARRARDRCLSACWVFAKLVVADATSQTPFRRSASLRKIFGGMLWKASMAFLDARGLLLRDTGHATADDHGVRLLAHELDAVTSPRRRVDEVSTYRPHPNEAGGPRSRR